MNTKRKLSFFLAVVFSLMLCPSAFAMGVPTSDFNSNESIQPQNMYDYAWKVASVTEYSKSYGPWREGPTGLGPGALDINSSIAISLDITNTITGNYSIGLSEIEQTCGCKIGITLTYGVNYSITLGENERKTIIFRPKFVTEKVVTEYWQYPTGAIYLEPKLLKTETCYVTKFIEWDYAWRWGY